MTDDNTDQYRRFVEEHNPLEEQLGKVNEVLAQLEMQIDQQAAVSTGSPAAVNPQ